jgi:hypothetical protein
MKEQDRKGFQSLAENISVILVPIVIRNATIF